MCLQGTSTQKLKVLQVARHVVRSTGGVVHTCACATGSICVPHPGVYDVHIYLHSRYMLNVRTCVPQVCRCVHMYTC